MMYLDVDRVGRLVLPKELRERYGITRGGRLELVDTGQGLLLTPQVAATPMTHLANGFPTLRTPGGEPDATDLNDLVASSRAERDARNLGSPYATE